MIKCKHCGKNVEGSTCRHCHTPVRAKDNGLDETISFIHSAINSLGDKFATLNVRNHLRIALRECQHVDKKRQKRKSAYEEMVQKGVSEHDRWWKMIQENVRKTAEDAAQKPEENAEPGNT